MTSKEASKSLPSLETAAEGVPMRAVSRGGRAISNSAFPSPSLSQQKTWQPWNGIAFQPSRGSTARLSTAAVVAIEQDLLLHSTAEDNYAMASTLGSRVNVDEGGRSVDGATETPAASTVIPQSDLPDPAPEDPRYDKLPESGSPWKMSEELFRAAKEADPLSPGSYWSYMLYRGPAEGKKEGNKVTVHYCQKKHTAERVMQSYFMNEKVIGFDIEWLQNAHKNLGPKNHVSLIQIASEERIALFHVALFLETKGEDLVPPSLKKVMEDPEVTKVGVAIKGDCTRMKNNLGVQSRGLFELSHLFKLIKYSESKDFKLINKKLVSLATQVQEHLHLPMYKGGEVRSSDWNKTISFEQIRYAASDSYAGVQLFDTMEMKRKALDPSPPRPYHAELNKPIRIAEGVEIPTDDPAEEGDIEDGETPTPVKQRKLRKKATPYPPVSTLDADLENALLATGRYGATTEPSKQPRAYKSKIPPVSVSMKMESGEPKPKINNHSQRTSDNWEGADTEITTSLNITTSSDPNWSTIDNPLTQAAESHALSHLTSSPSSDIPPISYLRTFYLWHYNPDLSLEQVATLLRKPPLSITVITRHILEVASSGGIEDVVELDLSRIKLVLQRWKELGFRGVMWRRLEMECAAKS
ncbi:hypothetical protein G7Y89_g8240 [Cudoniella acicularis]|uniref:3'-5' exonuclease domain-containing protein n=1 Tax=Cudoniella acicularis TaxID=354080 RepID=A0A8H4RGX5_9HELO|nr:hypothetical protein G7Y89_g8240 [Cudoniella acicularis]